MIIKLILDKYDKKNQHKSLQELESAVSNTNKYVLLLYVHIVYISLALNVYWYE